MRKKTISIDLDGVLNTYSGKYDEFEIAPIRDGAHEFIKTLAQDFTLEIFTVREKNLVQKWLIKNNLEQYIQDVTDKKNPFTSVFLDDRALNFDGDFTKALNSIKNFKPYWK